MATWEVWSKLTDDEEKAINPRNQMLPKIDALNGKSTVKEIHTALYLLRRSLEYFYDTDTEDEVQHPVYGESPWLLVCHPIGFVTGSERTNWSNLHDYGNFKNFSFLWNEALSRPVGEDKTPSKQRNAMRIGFFCTKLSTWGGKGNAWKKEPWHAWIGMIAHTRHHTELWIYDCNVLVEHPDKEEVNVVDLRIDMQRRFI